MITVVIIGILSTIAMAQYEQYVMRSQATELYTAIIIAKSGMEQTSLSNHGVYQDMSTTDFAPQINELRYFNQIACVATNAGQSYECSVTTSPNSVVNNKLRGVTYTFNNTDTSRSTAPASSGWPASNSCFVMSNGGC